jgi:uncharacterized repeat protein (TIGR03809 family)
MTHRVDVARGRDVVARWCALAEQRLEYLTELFETGRWRRFHSELEFLENIQEAKAAVETWRDLLTREPAPDHVALNISWVGRARTARRQDETSRDPAPRFQPQPLQVAIAPVHVSADEAPSAPDVDFDSNLDPAFEHAAAELTRDLAVMHERYPLLHNAL